MSDNNNAFLNAAAAMALGDPEKDTEQAPVSTVTDISKNATVERKAPIKNALDLHLRMNPDTPAESLQTYAEEQGGVSQMIDPKLINWDSKINQREQAWLNDQNPEYLRLRDNIRDNKQQVAIWVVANNDGKTFTGIFGSRRTSCCSDLNEKVWAMVFTENLSDEDAFIAAYAENKNRTDLSPYEEARNVQRYKAIHKNKSAATIGEFFGKSRHWVDRQLAFASADSSLLKCASDPWRITERSYRDLIAGLKNDPAREARKDKIIAEMIANNEVLSYRELFKSLNPPEVDAASAFKYDDSNRVLAEVSPLKVKGGRPYRIIKVYEGNTKKELADVVGELVKDIRAEVVFDS